MKVANLSPECLQPKGLMFATFDLYVCNLQKPRQNLFWIGRKTFLSPFMNINKSK